MTQVVTVSATTAAYAMENAKTPVRSSRNAFVEESTRHLAEKAAASQDFQLRALVNIVQPPALALYFLTASQKNFAQASLKETLEAYRNSAV